MDEYVAGVIKEVVEEKPETDGFIWVSCIEKGFIGNIDYRKHGILRTLSFFGFFGDMEFCRKEHCQSDAFAKIHLSQEKKAELQKLLMP